MSEWDEIKKLAADFQRLQESDTLQKISERNCIDIIKKLCELNLIDLIYTSDGREFVTPAQLTKEIQDEIYVNGGRMHLHDLASQCNVDYHHVESKAKDLMHDYPDEYFVVLGQVIHASYKDNLAKEINERLQSNGKITIAELSKTIDLPADFIYGIVNERLGTIIEGIVASHDPRTFYTSDFIARYRSKVSGALSGVSCPTTIASLLKRFDMQERVFLPIAEALIKEGRIDATIENRLFIPAIYAREQNEWIDNFYRQNSYIEYDVLSRMDIKQPKAFLRKKFSNCVFLKTCCVSQLISGQVESVIEECIASNGWMDLTTILPSILDKDDVELLVQDIFKSNKAFQTSSLIINQVNVCSIGFLATCKNSFGDVMKTKADEHLKEGKLLNYFVGGKVDEAGNPSAKAKPKNIPEDFEDDWDGQHGRGSGSKRDRRKNKGRASKRSISPDYQPKEPLTFLTVEEISERLSTSIEDDDDCSPDLLDSIANLIEEDLNITYVSIAHDVFSESLKKKQDETEGSDEIEVVS